jgi:Holliday junction resolvase
LKKGDKIPNKKYVKGATFERTIKHFLKSKKYECIRSAGSKGKIDLIAWKGEQGFIIQAKDTHLSMGAKLKLWNSLLEHQHYIFFKVLVLDKDYKRELKKCGV